MTSGLGTANLRGSRNAFEPRQPTMGSVQRTIRSFCAPLLHPKHVTRIQLHNATLPLTWSRAFHVSASWKVIDLAYTLHDNKASAKGDPIVIIHGLFGSKKNNRSVSKYVYRFECPGIHKDTILTLHHTAHLHALSIAPYTP